MKRCGNLWPEVTNIGNLLRAVRQAQRGKRWRENVLAFNFNLETELLQLHSELQSKTYQPSHHAAKQELMPLSRR